MSRVKHENEGFKSRITWLEVELSSKSTSELDTRRELSNKISELESKLILTESDLNGQSESLKHLKDQVAIKNEKLDMQSTQIRTLETEIAEKAATYSHEIDTHRRLADLFKNHSERDQERIVDLENAISTLKEAHQKQFASLKSRMQSELDRAEDVLNSQSTEAEQKITELMGRIAELEKDPRLLLDNLELESGGLLPSDQTEDKVAVNVIPADFGNLTATAMFDRVITSEKLARQEQIKRKEIELYMSEIMKKLEQKTPIIASQRR